MSSSRLRQEQVDLSDFERLLINELQTDFPLCAEPYSVLGAMLQCAPELILATIEDLLTRGVLTRFGPLLNIEKAGGAFSLCALKIPAQEFEKVSELVNSYPQVAHNYEREHEWNMWFVLATETDEELLQVFDEIVSRSDCPGLNLPKEKEFYVGLRLQA
jgi:DNA-binding Lrp family transcriptional regulator